MVLLVDAGNTRIKWAPLVAGRLRPAKAAAHARWRNADYARRLFGGDGSERALISSVAGPRVNQALAAAARRAKVSVRFVSVPRRGAGVTVGYRDPWRLGVDRYVAAVGAVSLFPQLPLCIVGVGTAMTIDLIGRDGRHRGGVIVPAPGLMVETLLHSTQGIRRRAQGGQVGGTAFFGRSTRDAIVQGSRYAAAALIDRAVEEGAKALGSRPLVVLTGGGAQTVRPLIASDWAGVPDLVLKGLAVLALE